MRAAFPLLVRLPVVRVIWVPAPAVMVVAVVFVVWVIELAVRLTPNVTVFTPAVWKNASSPEMKATVAAVPTVAVFQFAAERSQEPAPAPRPEVVLFKSQYLLAAWDTVEERTSTISAGITLNRVELANEGRSFIGFLELAENRI